MIIFLPKEIDGINDVEKELFKLNLLQLFEDMKTVKVDLTLPKFKMEKFIDMKNILQEVRIESSSYVLVTKVPDEMKTFQIGMKTMFGDCADFSKMYEVGQDPLYVSDVLHKAVIEVNEEGSEAAAASG